MTRMLIHAATAFLLTAAPLAAQTGDQPLSGEQTLPPPHLSVLEGLADLERGVDREAAMPNMPLEIGDRIRTHAGRAEILLGDGSAIHLDERTAVDINGDTLVRLIEGRIIVLAEQSSAGQLQIDAAPASVQLLSGGEVHLALVGLDADLHPRAGMAERVAEQVRQHADEVLSVAPDELGGGRLDLDDLSARFGRAAQPFGDAAGEGREVDPLDAL